MNKHIRHIGKVIAGIICFIVTAFFFIKVNLIYSGILWHVPILVYLLILIVFYVLLYNFYEKTILLFNLTFMVLISLSQAYVFSYFIQLTIEANGMADDGVALAWVIYIPLTIVLMFILGLIYDIVKNTKMKTLEKWGLK